MVGSRHKRIRRMSIAVWAVCAPLAGVLFLAWGYLRLFACWDSRIASLRFCRTAVTLPMIPVALGIGLFALVMWDLHALGRDIVPAASMHVRVKRGFGALERRHRRHVWAGAASLFTACVLVFGVLAALLYAGVYFR